MTAIASASHSGESALPMMGRTCHIQIAVVKDTTYALSCSGVLGPAGPSPARKSLSAKAFRGQPRTGRDHGRVRETMRAADALTGRGMAVRDDDPRPRGGTGPAGRLGPARRPGARSPAEVSGERCGERLR